MPSLERHVLYSSTSSTPVPITCMSAGPSGQQVACGTKDGRVLLLDAMTGEQTREVVGHDAMVSCVVLLDEGHQLLTSSWDGTTRLWKFGKESRCRAVLTHKSEVKALAVEPAVGHAVAGARDGEVKVFSIPTMKCLRNLQAHSSDISGLSMMEQGTQLLTSSWDGGCRLWNLENYNLIEQIAECRRRIRCMAVSPDHEYVFLGLHDGLIIGMKIRGSGPVYKLKGHSDVVSSLALNPSGTHVVSGSLDRTIRVWSIDGQQELTQGKLNTGITQVEFSREETRFYSTDFAGSLTAWTWNC